MKEAPWSNHKTLDHPDKEERLSLEILQFEEYISPTEFERTSRQKAQHDFEVFISSCIPDAKAVAFGSHVTGLFLPGSDMDLNIRGGDQRAIARIRKGLLKQGMCRYHEITYIPQAKVPVISIDSPRYPITIDITANNPSPSSDRTILWLKQYPELRPLYFVLKHALLGLQAPRPTFQPMSSKFGGMASYTLVCLIVNFLKEEAANHGCDSDSTTYYANVLVDILHFYSTFDFANKGIRFTEGESPYFSKGKRPPMMIIDPDIPESNVGRSSLFVEELQECFSFLYNSLTTQNPNQDHRSILRRIIPVADEEPSNGTPRYEGRDYRIEPLHMLYSETFAKVQANKQEKRQKRQEKRRQKMETKNAQNNNDDDDYVGNKRKRGNTDDSISIPGALKNNNKKWKGGDNSNKAFKSPRRKSDNVKAKHVRWD